MEKTYNNYQIEAAQITFDYFIHTYGVLKTIQYIKESKKYKNVYNNLLIRYIIRM